MDHSQVKPLIETSELAQILSDPKLTVINANFNFDYKAFVAKPADTWNQTFKNERIPNARFINLGKDGDQSQGLPNMLPTPEQFDKLARALDIGRNDHVVTYGDDGIVGACRAWWMFRVFGFKNVQVMNGTLAKWKLEQLPVETGEPAWKPRQRSDEDFKFEVQQDLAVTMAQIKTLISENTLNLVDARPAERFTGELQPPTQKQGHIPTAKNIPFVTFLNPDDTFKKPEELAELVAQANVDPTKPLQLSCGSGMNASVLNVGLFLLGAKQLAVYDGSWTEWVKHESNPIENGPTK